MYPDSCAGSFQSPVNIQTQSVVPNPSAEMCSCPTLTYNTLILNGELLNDGKMILKCVLTTNHAELHCSFKSF